MTCLLEKVADIFLAIEIADALSTDDALRPLASHKIVEESKVEGATGVINKRTDTIFLSLALIVVMVVMMVVLMVMMMLMVFVMMLVIVLIVVMMIMVIIVVIIIIVIVFQFVNPSG
jgi:hypothetical protein